MTAAIDISDYLSRIDSSSLEELETLEHELFGRKEGVLTVAMKDMKDLSNEEKKAKGQELNAIKQELVANIESRRQTLLVPSDDQLTKDRLDLSIRLPHKQRGHLHLIPEFISKVEEVFGRMGFEVATGPEIDTEEHNFDLLNFPKEHAARDHQDIFYLDTGRDGEDKWLLRGHTSTVQIRYMKDRKPSFRAIFPGKVYRKDADATHSPMFHQFEGLMIGENVSLANMKAVMETAIRELIDSTAEFRFRTGYFPFTEPSLEVDMRWRGDDSESREGKWLEIAGCGMVHPNVLTNVGIDAEKYQGFAFGFGIERMIMIKHQIPDLRSFYQGELSFLKQF